MDKSSSGWAFILEESSNSRLIVLPYGPDVTCSCGKVMETEELMREHYYGCNISYVEHAGESEPASVGQVPPPQKGD